MKSAFSQHINNSEGYDLMNSGFSFENLDKNKFQVLHEIENTDEIVGLKLKNTKRYIIPFSSISRESLIYIKTIVENQSKKSLSSLEICKTTIDQIWKEPFTTEKLQLVSKEINLVEKTIITKKEDLQRLEKEKKEIYSDFYILAFSGISLEVSLKKFLSKYQIETRQISRSDADFYFALPENKFCVVEVKGYEKKPLDEYPFNQLHKWRIDFAKCIKQKNNYDKFDEKNIVSLLIVNNDYKTDPEDRKLIIGNEIKTRYFEKDSAKQRVITTFDLFKILTSQNGKQKFFQKLLNNDQMQIKFD